MRIVLTGGAGFIGTHLAERLSDEHEVIIFDNLNRDSLSLTSLMERDNVTFHQGDVLDKHKLDWVFDGADVVIHLAAIAGVGAVLEKPIRTMAVNTIGTFNVLNCAHHMDVKKVVDFSTSEVFGAHAYDASEGNISPTVSMDDARWTYAMSKLAGEFMGNSYWKQYGFPVTTVRPFNVYGPRQLGEGAVAIFVKAALAGEPITVHGDGTAIRSWCYVDDMVDATLLALESRESDGVAFNIGNPRATLTMYQLAKLIISLTDSNSEIVLQDIDYADVAIRVPNISLAKSVLGFEPKVDLEEGLARTIAWYKDA